MPNEEEVRWAVGIWVAEEKAEREGKGAWGFEGLMVDKPVIGKARAVVERAEACGVDVEGERERWRRQVELE